LAFSTIKTMSPRNTPPAPLYASRTPRWAATDSTYIEFGPGSSTMKIVPSR
jgi:hypothetical protein